MRDSTTSRIARQSRVRAWHGRVPFKCFLLLVQPFHNFWIEVNLMLPFRLFLTPCIFIVYNRKIMIKQVTRPYLGIEVELLLLEVFSFAKHQVVENFVSSVNSPQHMAKAGMT